MLWIRDLLLIDEMILDDCHMHRKNLSTVWTDYCKAYDSVPHSVFEAVQGCP